MVDTDRMAAVLEASKKWQNGKTTIFYVLVSVYAPINDHSDCHISPP